MRKAGVLAAVAMALTLMSAPALAQAMPVWERLAGATRYDTMAAIARSGTASSPVAVVATGQGFADALCASALAGAHECPVLLTPPERLASQTAAELERLGVEEVVLMGGPAAIGESVEQAIRDRGLATTRVAGTNRVGTSVEALEATLAARPSDTVIVTTGAGFADALSIGPWAYATATPLVLAERDGSLADEVWATLRAHEELTHAIVVGGTEAVSEDTVRALEDTLVVERLAGDDRFATSARIASWEVAHGFDWDTPVVATGLDFPDALAGAPLAGGLRSPLLLVEYGLEDTAELLYAQRDILEAGYVLGGTQAVPFDDPTAEVGLPLAAASELGRGLVDAAETTPFAGRGWCAAWVQNVYDNAGHGMIWGNANDFYYGYCKSDDPARLEPGMIVAVPYHPHTDLGSIYGHVGVYVGDGWVRDNASRLRHLPLSLWLAHYGATATPRWGWLLNDMSTFV